MNDIQVIRRTLESRRVGFTLRQSLTYETDVDIPGELAHRLSAYVLSDHIAADTYTRTVQWPATTWQMFKSTHEESWWLSWLVRRRPVQMVTKRVEVTVNRFLTYPEASLAVRDLGRPFIYEEVRP